MFIKVVLRKFQLSTHEAFHIEKYLLFVEGKAVMKQQYVIIDIFRIASITNAVSRSSSWQLLSIWSWKEKADFLNKEVGKVNINVFILHVYYPI